MYVCWILFAFDEIFESLFALSEHAMPNVLLDKFVVVAISALPSMDIPSLMVAILATYLYRAEKRRIVTD